MRAARTCGAVSLVALPVKFDSGCCAPRANIAAVAQTMMEPNFGAKRLKPSLACKFVTHEVYPGCPLTEEVRAYFPAPLGREISLDATLRLNFQ